jgi:hypothetical protein
MAQVTFESFTPITNSSSVSVDDVLVGTTNYFIVDSVNVSANSGYNGNITSATATFYGGNPIRTATASVQFNSSTVTGVTMIDKGQGYRSEPTCYISVGTVAGGPNPQPRNTVNMVSDTPSGVEYKTSVNTLTPIVQGYTFANATNTKNITGPQTSEIAMNKNAISNSPTTAKAWVTFDGFGLVYNSGSATWVSNSNNLVTVTATAHGLIAEQWVKISNSNNPPNGINVNFDGLYKVVTGTATTGYANKFTITVPAINGNSTSGSTFNWQSDATYSSAVGSAWSSTANSYGFLITITSTAHGLIANQLVRISNTTKSSFDGLYKVVTGSTTSGYANKFTIQVVSLGGLGSGTLDWAATPIYSSYNVSSVSRTAAGTYTITFTNAMNSVNYACAGNSIGNDNYAVTINGTATGSPVLKSTTQVSINWNTGATLDCAEITFIAFGK